MPPKLSSGPARLRAGHLWLMLAAVSLLSVPCAQAQANPAGYALSFDGTNDYVGVSIGTALASNYTISAWVYLRQGGTYSSLPKRVGVVSGLCGTTAELMIHNDGNNASGPQYLELSRCDFYDSGSNSTAVIALSNWTHVAVTVTSNKQVSYFINGLPAGGWNAAGKDVSLGPNLRLGDNSVRRFDGLLDEVQIWNVARSPGERRFEGRTVDDQGITQIKLCEPVTQILRLAIGRMRSIQHNNLACLGLRRQRMTECQRADFLRQINGMTTWLRPESLTTAAPLRHRLVAMTGAAGALLLVHFLARHMDL